MEGFSTRARTVPRLADALTLATIVAAAWWSAEQRPTAAPTQAGSPAVVAASAVDAGSPPRAADGAKSGVELTTALGIDAIAGRAAAARTAVDPTRLRMEVRLTSLSR